MLSTDTDPNETLNSEQDVAQSFEENLTKNFTNLISPPKNIDEESGNKFDELICSLIKKQTERDNKAKNEISSRIKEVLSNISDRIKREQSHIFDYKFRDYLMSIGFNNESSIQLTNYLLDTYDGSLNLNELKEFFEQFESTGWKFNSELHFKKMITCSLMPGLLDAFTDEKNFRYDQLTDKLFQFILSHRIPAESINAPYLENNILIANLRQKILVENENKFYEENRKNKSIYVDEQCISSLKSCCCQEKIHNIIDGKWMTFWQTSNAEKWEDHYILIMLKENLKLTSLSLFSIGNKADEFLKSITIEVRAGGPEKLETVVSKCDYNLTLNNEYSICNCFPSNQNITYLKIVFKRLNEKSYWAKANEQLKIRSIKLVGQKLVTQRPNLSVQDASICWYFEMLSAMTLVQSQLIPTLHTKILQITKNTLENMPPLSLTLDSKATFLTPTVLEKVDSFLNSLLEVTSTSAEDKSESILIYVSFNLARGNLKGIMKSLLLILENFHLDYEFRSLIGKINEASQLSLRKTARKVGFKSLKIANEPKSEKLNETEIISTVEDESTEFSLESFRPIKESPFETNSCFNIVLEIENNVTLTNVNLKLKVESIGIHSVIVILLFDKTRPKIENFVHFDSFSSKEQFSSYIENSQKSKQSRLYEAFYFELYENQIDIMLEVPVTNMANYAIIKLLRPKENGPKLVSISNVNLVGYKHSSLDIFKNLKSLSSSLEKGSNSASILVSAILWFCCQLAEQHKNLASIWLEDEVKLIDFDKFQIDDLWKIYLKSIQLIEKKSPQSNDFLLSNVKVPILILLFELVNCAEIKLNLKQTKSSHILQSLCKIIDVYEGDKKNDNLDQKNQMLLDITKEIIRNGVGVFFQQNELIELFENLIKQNSACPDLNNDHVMFKQDMFLNKTSNQILFQAFCKQLTENKLGLVQYITKTQNPYENFTELSQIIIFVEKLVNLAFNNSLNIDFDTEFKLIRASNQLVNSLQSNVLYNIKNKIRNKQIDKDCVFENMMIKHINNFLSDYAKFLFSKVYDLQNMCKYDEKNKQRYQTRLDYFLRNILYTFLLWLASIFEDLESSLSTALSSECANLLNSINDACFVNKLSIDKNYEKEILLKSWTFNSNTKSSILDLVVEYTYPLANRYVIDLDIESKLNNSESSDSVSFTFIDSNEQVHNITKKVENKEVFDYQIEINSDSSLIFNIHSTKDLKSNNYFFLKFTVNAYGYNKPVNNPKVKDIVHLLSCLIGTNMHKTFSEIYKSNNEIPPAVQNAKSATLEKQNSKDESTDKNFLLCGFQHQFSVNSSIQAQIGLSEKNMAITNMSHEYHRILFRNSFYNSSGQNNPSEKKLHTFLLKISNNFSNWLHSVNNQDSKKIQKFLGLYDDNFFNPNTDWLKHKIGGLAVSEIIIKLFCAIVWHDTGINYEKLFDENDEPIFNENVMKAYKIADSTRLYIVEKQLIFKNKFGHSRRSLAEILEEKIMFLLNFNRIPTSIIDYELSRNSKHASSDSIASGLAIGKKKHLLPKIESKLTNLIYKFIFDQDILRVDSLEQILIIKKQNSELAHKNFDIASKFIQNLIQSCVNDQFKYELVLLFLSSFFSTNSSTKFTKFDSSSVKDQANAFFPSNLRPIMIHYLQNLYGCGLEKELLVQKSFYNFVEILLNFSKQFDKEYYQLSKNDKDRYIRLKCFVTCLLDIDWELKDLKFVTYLNLYGYLAKNMIISMPICEYKDERQLTPSDILEDFFDLSKEKFEQVVKIEKNKSESEVCKETPSGCSLPSVKEADEIEECSVEKSIRKESESFDVKIFPDMYQSLFQICCSKKFDTTSLLKSVSSSITTHEQYQKYLVARYMFWKYFSKLNTNFYCDNCEAVLTGFRYVCLECRDYCYCFTCFSRSIVEKKCESLEKCCKPLIDVSKSSSHQPTHPMLVLDHYCNQCQSLIIGKRLKCLDCFDFDLCLSCSRKPEFSPDGHNKDHKIKMIEPTILTSKSRDSSDAQTFLFLHSQFLFTNFALKICDLLNEYNSSSDQYEPLIRSMHSEVVNTLLYLTSRTDLEPSSKENEFVQDLKFYMFYNQKNIIGQLAYVMKATKHVIKNIDSEENFNLDFNSSKSFFDSLASETAQKSNTPSLMTILNYVLTLQDKVYHNIFADNISIMFIGMMRSWLSILDPVSVNRLVKSHLDKNENNFIFQEVSESKREYTLELIFCWIYEYMTTGFDKLACSYLDLMFGLNQIEQWKPNVKNFLSNILEKISESLDEYKPKIHSKFYFLIYAVICFQMDISSGQWVDYKSNSQYDGAGILRSTDDFKIGLANNFYSESFGSDSFLSIKDPESRRTVSLKYKRLDNTWRKSNQKSKIPIKSSFDLDQDFFLKLIEIFKKIFSPYVDTESLSDIENTKSIAVNEKNHIGKKREFYKFFKQKIAFNKNLLVLGLINLMQSNVNMIDENLVDLQPLDSEFLNLVSKISFLNTNLNSNWKLNHLNIFLTSLLLFDNFSLIKNSLEKEDTKDETPVSESKHASKTVSLMTGEKSRLNRTTDLDEGKKNSTKDDLLADDLLGEENAAIMSVCDISSRIFPMEDMMSNFDENADLDQRRNKASLKLIEDCFNKLSKYETNRSDDAKAGQLFPKQQAGEPIKAAIKIVSHACIVLSSRELLVSLMNVSAKLAKNDLMPKKESFLELNLNSEYELMQLLDVLHYSEKELNFKFFVKYFIRSFINKEKSDKLVKILNRVCSMACDFMLPEFKLLRKVSWSYEDVRFNDQGMLKNKINYEPLSEENINFNSSQINKTLSEVEKLTSITSKPNDVEKLSTQDQSTLLIVFDQELDKKAHLEELNANKFENYFGQSLKKSNFSKYCLGDDFEFKDEVFSDTESVNSIEECDSPLLNSKKKTAKKKSIGDLNEDFDSSLDEDEDEIYEENSTVCSDRPLDKKNSLKAKKTSILFQIVPMGKNSNYQTNDEYDEDDQEDDDHEGDDEDEETQSESEDSSDASSNYEFTHNSSVDDFYADDRWDISANNTGFTDSQDNRTRKKKFKINLENLSTIPFIAIKNEKMLKWKFCRDNYDTINERCSFKIFTTLSKNFESAFNILEEIISQAKCDQLNLNDIWCSLIKICCLQAFNKRLKVLGLLIKIIQKVYEAPDCEHCINIFEIKPLRNLHIMVETYNTEDKNFTRALYELFFFAEKLAIKWSIQNEYWIKLKDKEYFLEKVVETGYLINILTNSIHGTNAEQDLTKVNTLAEMFKEAESEESSDDEIYSSPQGGSRKNSDEEYRESREEINLLEENW